jgi:dTMP kinase
VFATFEGIEGSGKTTQLARLATALRRKGYLLTPSREPGGTDVGERIRPLLTDPATPLSATAELLLYLADRAHHVHTKIRPALAAGHIVLCDRFSDSTLAYQGYGRGGDLATIRQLDAIARDGCGPDLTFLLDCPVSVGLDRALKRPGTHRHADRFEREPPAFHERVRAGFLELARAEPERFVILDSLGPCEETTERALAESLRRLGPPGTLAGPNPR